MGNFSDITAWPKPAGSGRTQSGSLGWAWWVWLAFSQVQNVIVPLWKGASTFFVCLDLNNGPFQAQFQNLGPLTIFTHRLDDVGNLYSYIAQSSACSDRWWNEPQAYGKKQLQTWLSSSEKWKQNTLGAISQGEGAEVATSSLQRKATRFMWNVTVLI